MKKFNSIEFIKKLIQLAPRQLKNETLARNLIINVLKQNNIEFILQNFTISVPVYERYFLKADNKDIRCLPTALKSGSIISKENLISSLIFSHEIPNEPNINFNPYSSSVSLPNFYFSPSLAISREDLPKIFNAKKINGEVKVKKFPHKSTNILAGNTKNPQNIIFAHYDGLGKGAVDNASGVAASLEAIISYPHVLKNNLIIFAGAEELSFDNPTYWGYGFRIFEKKHSLLMKQAKKIIIIDCVGSDIPEIINDKKLAFLFFPIKNFKKLSPKTFILSSVVKFDKFMEFYHSELDDMSRISKKHLTAATAKLIKLIS